MIHYIFTHKTWDLYRTLQQLEQATQAAERGERVELIQIPDDAPYRDREEVRVVKS